jgi:hypothetical protein
MVDFLVEDFAASDPKHGGTDVWSRRGCDRRQVTMMRDDLARCKPEGIRW